MIATSQLSHLTIDRHSKEATRKLLSMEILKILTEII